MQLYRAALEMVRGLPDDTHAGLVIRHSARHPILSDDDIFSAGLTAEGVSQAEQFGKALTAIRKPGRMVSSPVERCLDTAQAISRGAGWEQTIQANYRLSHPFIERVWSGPWRQWKKDPVPDPLQAILDLVLNSVEMPGSLDIFSTHDTVVGVLAGYFTGVSFQYPDYWPDFLEGVLFWRNANRVHLKWREFETTLEPWPPKRNTQMELGL